MKDVILPGEMKTILNQVVEAEKVAQANLIRRREETAATRSLLNTAADGGEPGLLRLKELETLEKVTERIGKTAVYDGLEGVEEHGAQAREAADPLNGRRRFGGDFRVGREPLTWANDILERKPRRSKTRAAAT